MEAYGKLDKSVQEKLRTEKQLLDSLREKLNQIITPATRGAKDYVIEDLKHLGKNPVLVSSNYIPSSNEQIIGLRKGKPGGSEDFHFMLKHKLDNKWWHKPGETSILRLKSSGWSSGWIPEFYNSYKRVWGIDSGSYNSNTYYIKYKIR